MSLSRIITRLACAALVSGALMSQSCSTSRSVPSRPSASVAPSQVGPSNLAAVMGASYGAWTDAYIPFKLKMAAPVSLSVSGRATMVYGRSVHMSLRVFGMEVAVFHADNDSAWLVDRMHKYICTVPLSSLTGRTGLTLANVQDIMIGRAVYPGAASPADGRFEVSDAPGGGWIMVPETQSAVASWSMTVNAGACLTSVDVTPAGRGTFSAVFSDFVNTVVGTVASDVDLSGRIGTRQARAAIDWDMTKAEWNGGRKSGWTAPSGYKRISPDNLSDVLKQL